MDIQNRLDQLNVLYVKFDKNLKITDASKPYLDFVKCDSLSDVLGKECPDLFKKEHSFFCEDSNLYNIEGYDRTALMYKGKIKVADNNYVGFGKILPSVLNGEVEFKNVRSCRIIGDDLISWVFNSNLTTDEQGNVDGIELVGLEVDPNAFPFPNNKSFYDKNNGYFYLGEGFASTHLTPKELDVLKLLLVEFGTDAQIAMELGITRGCCSNYINLLRTKLGCATRSELFEVALKNGWYYFFGLRS